MKDEKGNSSFHFVTLKKVLTIKAYIYSWYFYIYRDFKVETAAVCKMISAVNDTKHEGR